VENKIPGVWLLAGVYQLFWHLLTFAGTCVGLSCIHPITFVWSPMLAHALCGLGPKHQGTIHDGAPPQHGFFCPPMHDDAFHKAAGNFARQRILFHQPLVLLANLFLWVLSITLLWLPFAKCLMWSGPVWVDEETYLANDKQDRSDGFALLHVLTPWAVSSLLFMTVTQISHIQEECQQEASIAETDPYKRQALTSLDYSTDSLLNHFIFGGLNTQSLHHVLPSIACVHYRALYPAFLAVCKKHNCEPVVVPSFWHAVWKHLVYVFRLGEKGRFVSVTAAAVAARDVASAGKPHFATVDGTDRSDTVEDSSNHSNPPSNNSSTHPSSDNDKSAMDRPKLVSAEGVASLDVETTDHGNAVGSAACSSAV